MPDLHEIETAAVLARFVAAETRVAAIEARQRGAAAETVREAEVLAKGARLVAARASAALELAQAETARNVAAPPAMSPLEIETRIRLALSGGSMLNRRAISHAIKIRPSLVAGALQALAQRREIVRASGGWQLAQHA